jgi:glutamine synthetase
MGSGASSNASLKILEDAINETKVLDVLEQMKEVDPLSNHSTAIWDDATMATYLPKDVHDRFKACLVSGEPTSPEDQAIIATSMFTWARSIGATDFAHWFFPMRGGGGALGGQVGAYKMDAFIDLDWKSSSPNKPFKTTFPPERLFQGETDGSSFPNGGLRVTHSAAAFTTWDRSSPPVVVDKVLMIPCSFVTHYGKCIDDKTPLLRSCDALQTEGKRLFKNVGLCTDANAIYSYLGWEQEFFVIDSKHYLARPDLVNCGRTLIGKLPTRNQQQDLNYFGPVPFRVEKLLRIVHAQMLKVGCPMSVRHNEVAPAQHEMSPIFKVSNASADNNVLFMEIMHREANKLGLHVLFHEKPFAGINGSGKHANWSVGTDTGMNFFYPGKDDNGRTLFVVGVACLAHGLLQHNELVRCAVAHAGNDHRLGAQEAPPAIISLYPGTGFEAHVDSIIAGGSLLGYKAEKKLQSTGCSSSMPVETNIEDRNRTAPFPFCSNRFEFRAVGSSQNCSFPIMICNTIMASGMSHLSDLIESGTSLRDAVAQLYQENRNIIFTGNGYSAEWPVEAAKRGLPNLNTTPKAVATFNSEKNKAVFEKLQILSPEETDARAEVMYEAYNVTLNIEAKTMIDMMETGIIPACAKDLEKYVHCKELAGDRMSVYSQIVQETNKLKELLAKVPHDLKAEAEYLCDTLKPQMVALRNAVDKAESLMESNFYPYPSYETLIYSHHH